jgi:hypothetical protein
MEHFAGYAVARTPATKRYSRSVSFFQVAGLRSFLGRKNVEGIPAKIPFEGTFQGTSPHHMARAELLNAIRGSGKLCSDFRAYRLRLGM